MGSPLAAPGHPPAGVDAQGESIADPTLHARVRQMLDEFADRTGLEHFRSTGVWTVGLDPAELARRQREGFARYRTRRRAEVTALTAWIVAQL